jgi:hypothetical protein
MNSITGRIEKQGAFGQATIMATPQHIKRLKRAGTPPPQPVTVRALIDTGAASCVLDSGIISRLNLIQTGRTFIHTPSTGTAYQEHEIYDASVFLGSLAGGVTSFNVEAVRSDLASEGFLAIIGWDILSKCVLLCDGPAGTFRLDY